MQNETPESCKKSIWESLIRWIFTVKYSEPVVFADALKLMAEFSCYINDTRNNLSMISLLILDIEKVLNYQNFDKKWNMIISYNPKFIEKYYKALFYLGIIIDSMWDDDMVSLFTYSGDHLKRIINRKNVGNIDLDENIDNFLNVNFGVDTPDTHDFLSRLEKFLTHKHFETKKFLMDSTYKNLIVAFTTTMEWKDKKMSSKVTSLIHSTRIEFFKKKQSLKLCLIIVMFDDQPLLDSKWYT